jgi:hypothetical protein
MTMQELPWINPPSDFAIHKRSKAPTPAA